MSKKLSSLWEWKVLMRGICDRRSAGAHLCEGIIFRQSLCNFWRNARTVCSKWPLYVTWIRDLYIYLVHLWLNFLRSYFGLFWPEFGWKLWPNLRSGESVNFGMGDFCILCSWLYHQPSQLKQEWEFQHHCHHETKGVHVQVKSGNLFEMIQVKSIFI